MTNVNVLSNSKKIFIFCWTIKLKIFLTLKAIIFIPPDYEILLEKRKEINFARRNAAHKLLLKHHLEKLDYQILIECLESRESELRGIAWIQLDTLPIDTMDLKILESYLNHKNQHIKGTALYLIKKIEKANSAST